MQEDKLKISLINIDRRIWELADTKDARDGHARKIDENRVGIPFDHPFETRRLE